MYSSMYARPRDPHDQKSGQLEKRGSGLLWSGKTVLLKGNLLYIATETVLHGSKCKVEGPFKALGAKAELAPREFKVQCSDGSTFHFRAVSSDEAHSWVKAIKRATKDQSSNQENKQRASQSQSQHQPSSQKQSGSSAESRPSAQQNQQQNQNKRISFLTAKLNKVEAALGIK